MMLFDEAKVRELALCDPASSPNQLVEFLQEVEKQIGTTCGITGTRVEIALPSCGVTVTGVATHRGWQPWWCADDPELWVQPADRLKTGEYRNCPWRIFKRDLHLVTRRDRETVLLFPLEGDVLNLRERIDPWWSVELIRDRRLMPQISLAHLIPKTLWNAHTCPDAGNNLTTCSFALNSWKADWIPCSVSSWVSRQDYLAAVSRHLRAVLGPANASAAQTKFEHLRW